MGVILGACSFCNEHDGHTIDKRLEWVRRLTGKSIKRLARDRGYRGKKEILTKTQILIPDTPRAKDTYSQRKKKHKLFCQRAGI